MAIDVVAEVVVALESAVVVGAGVPRCIKVDLTSQRSQQLMLGLIVSLPSMSFKASSVWASRAILAQLALMSEVVA